MSISFYPYVWNPAGKLWAIAPGVRERMYPEIHPTPGTAEYQAYCNDTSCEIKLPPNPRYDPRLNINLNDRNAKLVLNELGFLGPDMDAYNCAPMPLDQFEIAVRSTIARNPEPVPGFNGYVMRQPGRMTIIAGGVPDGYVNERLRDLLNLVEAAKELGAFHVGWA